MAQRKKKSRSTHAGKIFILAVTSYIFSFYAETKSEKLPDYSELLEEVSEVPAQSPSEEASYSFNYRDKDYLIQPVSDYKLTGLVVSHNDISNFADIYHSKDSVDFRDICVIWGDNALDNTYLKINFWSEPFSCWVQAADRESHREFVYSDFSNNHLLSEDEEIIAAIQNARVGDQIVLEGMLVDYSPIESPERLRKTSITRDDTGNGACEIIMVESFEVLKTANEMWRKIENISGKLALFSFLASLVLGIIGVYR